MQYRDLQEFHKQNGHCYVTRGSDEESISLSSWVHVQRKHKRNHDKGQSTPLTEERISLLEKLNFDWAPSISGGIQKLAQAGRDENWEEVFAKLVEHKKQHGDANPKKKVEVLGPWACRMRKLYNEKLEGKSTTLTDEKIAKLQSIGFKFDSPRRQTATDVSQSV